MVSPSKSWHQGSLPSAFGTRGRIPRLAIEQTGEEDVIIAALNMSVDPQGLKHLLRELALPAVALFLTALSYFLNKLSVNPARKKWLLGALIAAIVMFLLALVRLWVVHKF